MNDSKLHNKALLDKLLTANNNGWKLDLFVSIDEDYLCTQCKNISKKAVTLVCESEEGEDEHKDEDIKLYCESCLKNIISNNANKCPVSNHSNPKYMSSRITRRKILKAHVLCPNSVQYKQKMNEAENINSNKIDSNSNIISATFYSTNEGKKGLKSKNVDGQGCTFEGTLGELIEEHIHMCIKKQLLLTQESNNNSSANQMRLYIIEDLQEKIIEMKKEIECLKNKAKKNEENCESLKKEMRLEMTAMKIEFSNKMKSIENLMQNEMKVNANVNEKQYKIIEYLSLPLVNIPLRFHSCRKAYNDTYHPRNVLQPGKKPYYASALNSDFSKNEKDWIIFEVSARQLYIPCQIKILIIGDNQSVKSMEVWFGSVNSNEWQKLHSSNVINVEIQGKALQTFELDRYGSLHSVVNQKKWNQIKVIFVENHGSTNIDSCKFIFCEIQFHGKRMPM